MKSPHTVAHRASLAYRMFVLAAESRDYWLRNKNSGDKYFSPTVQKYYTGISLSRYVFLVGIEFPFILLVSLLTWLSFGASLIYFIVKLVDSTSRTLDTIWPALFFLTMYILSHIIIIILIFALLNGIISWAYSGPNSFTRFLRKHFFKLPYFHRGDDLNKFPGPVALFKKWILSKYNNVPSQITWDSGKRRRR